VLGDLNGDYQVNNVDASIFGQNWNQDPGKTYNQGDLNGDGYVNNLDSSAFGANWGAKLLPPADFDLDLDVDKDDMKQIGNNWGEYVPSGTSGDANRDTFVDELDVNILNGNWLFEGFTKPYPTEPALGDINRDGLGDFLIDDEDATLIANHWGDNCRFEDCQGADLNNDGTVNGSDGSLYSALYDPYGPADINEDLEVDNADLSVLIGNWNSHVSGKGNGDLNADGYVDGFDFAIMADWWGRNIDSVSEQPPIPEPSTIAVLGVLAIGFLTTSRCARHRGACI
jgi:Dockerin type I domain